MSTPNKKAMKNFFGGAARHSQRKQFAAEQQAAAEAAEKARRQAELAAAERLVKKTFPKYFKSVDPIVQALEKLPPRDGNEFFARVDLSPNGWDCNTNVRGPEINMWIFYTRRATDADSGSPLSQTHPVAICEKGTTWEDNESLHLYLNDLPMLRVRSKPQADGSMKIKVEHVEVYYDCVGRKTSGSGSYRCGRDGNMYVEREFVTERAELKSIAELPGAIGNWVAAATPERLEDMRRVMDGVDPGALVEKMPVMKPLAFKKPSP